ncbi:MAG: hypothetical protein JW953_02050 [Anaerolineae bacterium]|nr:hypothetical protein [Anaerolineae bacterium]
MSEHLATARQLAFLSRLIARAGRGVYEQEKQRFGITKSATQLTKDEAACLIAALLDERRQAHRGRKNE